ncbi:hypothetical protein C5167_044148 [Papaver somniferum]|uniref:Uncharacterized protein n=1 Tax=Papaver somniferum TaxID=3469 RepID=A0A4Y7LAN0_PAPSO|nr:hypothetical protein C5167_044148 [Papaver somniferum]
MLMLAADEIQSILKILCYLTNNGCKIHKQGYEVGLLLNRQQWYNVNRNRSRKREECERIVDAKAKAGSDSDVVAALVLQAGVAVKDREVHQLWRMLAEFEMRMMISMDDMCVVLLGFFIFL